MVGWRERSGGVARPGEGMNRVPSISERTNRHGNKGETGDRDQSQKV
jgi:hypothetical protein